MNHYNATQQPLPRRLVYTLMIALIAIPTTASAQENVGIGTNSPEAKLDISRTGNGTNILRLSTERPWVFRQTGVGAQANLTLQSTVNSKRFILLSPDSSNRAAEFHVHDVASNVLLVPDGGEVGIALVPNGDPKARLHVGHNSSTGWPQLRLTETEYDFARLKMENTADPGTYWDIAGRSDSVASNGRLNFYYKSPGGTGDRMTITGDGRVGIGTTNPTEKLHVTGAIRVADLAGSGDRNVIVDPNGKFKIGTLGAGDSDWTETTNYVYNNTHDIGIGTNSPGARLHIMGATSGGAIRMTFPGSPPFFNDNYHMSLDADQINVTGNIFNTLKIMDTSSGDIKMVGGGGNVGVGLGVGDVPDCKLTIKGPDNNGTVAPLRIGTSGSEKMLIDGNEIDVFNSTHGLRINHNSELPVTIGTHQAATGYMLSVAGKIIGEEVRVQLEGSWPDYVFADDYKLTPLDQLEEEIKSVGHLPGIPSAQEVEEEGIALGEMQRKMMEKIEELTLYVIEQQKVIEDLRDKVESLQTQN